VWAVREKAKQIVELLNDTTRIREEREKSRALRDKYVGIAGDDRFSGMGARWPALYFKDLCA
jgi:epsin